MAQRRRSGRRRAREHLTWQTLIVACTVNERTTKRADRCVGWIRTTTGRRPTWRRFAPPQLTSDRKALTSLKLRFGTKPDRPDHAASETTRNVQPPRRPGPLWYGTFDRPPSLQIMRFGAGMVEVLATALRCRIGEVTEAAGVNIQIGYANSASPISLRRPRRVDN